MITWCWRNLLDFTQVEFSSARFGDQFVPLFQLVILKFSSLILYVFLHYNLLILVLITLQAFYNKTYGDVVCDFYSINLVNFVNYIQFIAAIMPFSMKDK